MMKKALSLILVIAMLLTLCGCGSSSTPKKPIEDISDEDWEAAAEALVEAYEEEPVAETEAAAKIYQVGETISIMNGKYEFTIHDVSFSEEGRQWAPDEGNVYLHYTATLICTEDVKEETQFVIGHEQLLYGDGYTFYGGSPDVFGNTTFRSNMAVFEPLSDNNTREVLGEIQVPEQVGTDTESTIFLPVGFGEYNRSLYETVQIQLR